MNAERLGELLTYEAKTGLFRWNVSRGRNAKAGDVAGFLRADGYTSIKLDRSEYKAHRLAWLYVYGDWPEHEIDHLNGQRSDNRIENLRDVSRQMNVQNQRTPSKNNKTGFLGVAPSRHKFTAHIGHAGKLFYLGIFETPDLAHQAYVSAKRKLHEGSTL